MKKVYEENNIKAIADSIREKTLTDKKYKTSEMAEGISEVYDAGKQAYNEEFWRRLFWGGNRENINYLFAYCDFTGYTIPNNYGKISSKVTNLQRMFRWYKGTEIPKGLDLSNVTTTASTSNMFSDTNLVILLEIGLPAMTAYADSFSYSSKLVTIEVLRCTEETTFTVGTFTATYALSNITFEGVIGRSIAFNDSPLSIKSLKNIIIHLKDYSGTDSEYAYTVTFKTSAFEALEAEGATAEYNGIACTWAELIDNKKWNLVKA